MAEESATKEEVEKTAVALALRDGTAKPLGIKLLIFGAECVGKTSVAATLVDEKFQMDYGATKGADITICNAAANWIRITKEEVRQRLQIEFLSNLAIFTESSTTSAKVSVSAKKEAESISAKQVTPPHLAGKKKQGTSNYAAKLPLPKVAAEEMAAVKAVRKKGVTKVLKTRNGIHVTIIDFAGLVQYHNTQSIFVRKDNVIMIVFNASQPLSANVKVRSSTLQKDPMTYSQNIHFWMHAVHSICHEPGDATDKASLLPVIILVATHLDLLGPFAEERKEQIIQTLAMELKGKPYAKHLAGYGKGLLNALKKYCIFLSNKMRDPKTIKQLQDAIIDVSFPTLSRENPLVYLKIERELLGIQKGMITIEEFHTIVQECGFLAAIDSKEFAYAVEYFHNNGTVLKFASKKLVILSPHWVIKLLSYLVFADPFKVTGNGWDISFNNLKQRGILLESFLSYMLECFNNSGDTEYQIHQNVAVNLMESFGFIAHISSKTKILDKEVKIVTQEKGLYIVPSLLPDDHQDQKQLREKDDEGVRIVYYHFPDEFLPLMLFNQLVAMCINKNEEKHEDLIWLRKEKVKIVLDRHQQYCVSLHEDTSSIRLSFLLHGKHSSAEQRYQLFQYIQSKLELLMNDFMQASAKPKAYIPCCYCHHFHVKAQLVCSKKYRYCPTQERPLPDDYYSDLFPNQFIVTNAANQSTDSQVTIAEVTGTIGQECCIHESKLKQLDVELLEKNSQLKIQNDEVVKLEELIQKQKEEKAAYERKLEELDNELLEKSSQLKLQNDDVIKLREDKQNLLHKQEEEKGKYESKLKHLNDNVVKVEELQKEEKAAYESKLEELDAKLIEKSSLLEFQNCEVIKLREDKQDLLQQQEVEYLKFVSRGALIH